MRKYLAEGIPSTLPPNPQNDSDVDHAPKRKQILNNQEKKLALHNALRYFPENMHEDLALEFSEELESYGRIWTVSYTHLRAHET